MRRPQQRLPRQEAIPTGQPMPSIRKTIDLMFLTSDFEETPKERERCKNPQTGTCPVHTNSAGRHQWQSYRDRVQECLQRPRSHMRPRHAREPDASFATPGPPASRRCGPLCQPGTAPSAFAVRTAGRSRRQRMIGATRASLAWPCGRAERNRPTRTT